MTWCKSVSGSFSSAFCNLGMKAGLHNLGVKWALRIVAGSWAGLKTGSSRNSARYPAYRLRCIGSKSSVTEVCQPWLRFLTVGVLTHFSRQVLDSSPRSQGVIA